MVKLALMCKSKNFTSTGGHIFKSGQWVIAEKRRRELLGEKVILTSSRKSPAYMGGTIIGFDPLANGKVEVIFKEEEDIVGNSDSIDHRGWGSGRGVCYI